MFAVDNPNEFADARCPGHSDQGSAHLRIGTRLATLCVRYDRLE